MKTSVTDLRYRTKEVSPALEAKEEIVLTHRGTEKGKIVPTTAKSVSKTIISAHPAVGMWTNELETVAEKITRIRNATPC